MLHFITCHGRIMPRLAELLFASSPDHEPKGHLIDLKLGRMHWGVLESKNS